MQYEHSEVNFECNDENPCSKRLELQLPENHFLVRRFFGGENSVVLNDVVHDQGCSGHSLPNLSSQSFGNAKFHQCWKSLWILKRVFNVPLGQNLVPLFQLCSTAIFADIAKSRKDCFFIVIVFFVGLRGLQICFI